MKNKFKTKKLWLIIGGIVLLLGIASFGVYKFIQTDKRKARRISLIKLSLLFQKNCRLFPRQKKKN
jgi:hypothetical protein